MSVKIRKEYVPKHAYSGSGISGSDGLKRNYITLDLARVISESIQRCPTAHTLTDLEKRVHALAEGYENALMFEYKGRLTVILKELVCATGNTRTHWFLVLADFIEREYPSLPVPHSVPTYYAVARRFTTPENIEDYLEQSCL